MKKLFIGSVLLMERTTKMILLQLFNNMKNENKIFGIFLTTDRNNFIYMKGYLLFSTWKLPLQNVTVIWNPAFEDARITFLSLYSIYTKLRH